MRARRVLVALFIGACSGSGAQTEAPSPAAAPASSETTEAGYPDGLVEIGGELAPVPFAPGALAESLHAGATMTYRMEPAGQDPFLLTTEFVAVDATGATMRDVVTTLDGTPRGEPKSKTATWQQLESHAHFPRASTAVTEAQVQVMDKSLPAYQYVITATEDGKTATTRLWFAKELPGPPVKMVRAVDGDVVLSMVLVSTRRPR